MQVSIKETVVPAPTGKPRMTKPEAGYVDPPLNGQGIRCGNCAFYVDDGTPLGRCTEMAGDANEQYGVCEMWAERRTKPTPEMIKFGNQKTKEEAGYIEISPDGAKCTACKHFEQPNSCDMVGYPFEGNIEKLGCCREFEQPKYEEKDSANPRVMREALVSNAITDEIHRMKLEGIPDAEILRVVQSYMLEDNPVDSNPWPGPIVGIDNMPQITMADPTTKEPPIYQPNTTGPTQPFWIPNLNPYPANPSPFEIKSPISVQNLPNPVPSANWLHDAAHQGMEPSMHGEEGWVGSKLVPEWRYPIEDSQSNAGNDPPISIPPSYLAPQFEDNNLHINETEPQLAQYVYTSHDRDDVCKGFAGKVFDLNDSVHRPIIPSENLGYTTTHPNCQCYWRKLQTSIKPLSTANKKQQKELTKIKKHITHAANKGELHTVKEDGKLSKRTRKSNPMRETIEEIRKDFEWLSDDYLTAAKKMADTKGGVLYLIRAAEEAITDHRAEGEPYRRALDAYELHAMARTGIGKHADINHYGKNYQTDLDVLDAEFDKDRKQIQFMVIERDDEINQGIANGQITAVSINGGAPRSEIIAPCVDGCTDGTCEVCSHPRGVSLGEDDDIGFTWVVTNPSGFMWHGQKIPSAKPGISTTGIERL